MDLVDWKSARDVLRTFVYSDLLQPSVQVWYADVVAVEHC